MENTTETPTEATNETEATTETAAETSATSTGENSAQSTESAEKQFTQNDIDKAVSEAKKQAVEDWKEEQNEAKRLSKLTTEEREKEQLKKDRAKFDKEKAEFAHQQLIAETKNQLMERKLPASFAANLCGKNAEETKANIDAFEKDFKAAIEAAVTDRMKGTSPKRGDGGGETDPFLNGLGM